ncbi:Cation/acetate symporter ActP [compost metagenome]
MGIITTRMTGISFELGIFVALGGMLVCSFLGGMRAVTWTQVGQYIILVIAYLVPVVWLSIKHTNMPLPQLSAGAVLQQVTEKEVYLQNDPSEIEVRRLWQQHADEMARRVEALPESWALEKDKLRSRLAQLNASEAPMVDIRSAERELASYPPTVEDARVAWSQSKATFEARAAPPTPHAEPFPAKDPEERRNMRVNFLALVLCLMLGTAGMPHILMRSYTTPSVIEARKSVCWSLLFILLLYFMAPALALLVKYEVYTQVVGSNFLSLPNWVHAWSAVDTNLLDVTDINRDGVVQLSEISMGADVVVLAMPEIGGLPYVISGLVAAGGLAAALSTADGLLLTLSNSLSHDMWYRMVSPRMSAARRVMVSKILLLVVAFGAAWVAARKPADILFMVSAAFSFAASSFFPALVMGVFWRRANKWGATLGMAAGLAVTFAYMTHTHPWLRESVLGISRTQPVDLWWGIQPIAAGIFGAPVAFLTIVVVSLLTPPPDRATLALVDYLRNPAARNPQAENT